MKPRVRKSIKFTLALAASLAALITGAGCDPYQLQPYPRQYPWQQYPPPGPRALPPAPPVNQGPVHLRDVEDLIWRYTNDIRQRYGCSPLGQEEALSGVSQAYCDDMLLRRFFSHNNPEGLTAGDRLRPFYSGAISGWGENIWEGSNLSAADRDALARRILDGWMSSPGHRQNILSPDFTHLGVGVAASGQEIRATQLFATLPRHPR